MLLAILKKVTQIEIRKVIHFTMFLALAIYPRIPAPLEEQRALNKTHTLTQLDQVVIVLWTTFLCGCEMTYIFGNGIVKWMIFYREMAYIKSKPIVKWPTFYREMAYKIRFFIQYSQGFADSQPFNHVCYITTQTGLRPNVGDFFGD